MKQSKKLSLLEAISNTVIGLIISFFAQIIIFSVMEIPVTHKENIVITMIFFVLSFVRSYILRRIFNRKSAKNTLYLNENATYYIEVLAKKHNCTEADVLNSIVVAHGLAPLNNSKKSSK